MAAGHQQLQTVTWIFEFASAGLGHENNSDAADRTDQPEPLSSVRCTRSIAIMSTQEGSGIEFSIVPEENQEHLRLLELPADLLNILTSENPPMFVFSVSVGHRC